ncbi:peptidase associated/transthyretin-like domain-containing protein, partial [Aetokthonos hydrillicola]
MVYRFQILDPIGQPVPGARVRIESLFDVSDGEGQCLFLIEDSMIGRPITIIVVAQGYTPYRRNTVFSSRNGVESVQLGNALENPSEPPIAIKVAKIGAIATVTAALITGLVMQFSNKFT